MSTGRMQKLLECPQMPPKDLVNNVQGLFRGLICSGTQYAEKYIYRGMHTLINGNSQLSNMTVLGYID